MSPKEYDATQNSTIRRLDGMVMTVNILIDVICGRMTHLLYFPLYLVQSFKS